jgi:hypothetical protein
MLNQARAAGRKLAVALRRWGAWALIADGCVWLAYGYLTREFAPRYWSATRTVDRLAVGLYVGGLFLLALSLAAIQARQARRARWFGWIAFLIAFAGAALAGAGDFAEDGLRIPAGVNAFFAGMLLLAVGLLLFGLATLFARALPVWCGALLLPSLVVGYRFGGLWSRWDGTVGFGLLWLALGGYLALTTPHPR